MIDHDTFETSVAAFVLGAADADEAAGVRTHLQSCAGCRELAQRLGRAVEAIPLAAEELVPPDRLRERILTAAASSRVTSPAPARGNLLRFPRRAPVRKPFAFDYRSAAVAGLALAVIGLGAWNAVLTNRIQNQAPASAVASSNLVGTGPMAAAQGRVIDLRAQGVTLVSFKSLPTLTTGRVYELWLIDGSGRATGAAVFRPGPDGSQVVVLSRQLTGVKEVAVTVEAGPDGASAPTQAPQLTGGVA